MIHQKTKDKEKCSTTTASQKRGKKEEKQSVISAVDSIIQDQQHANSYDVSNAVSVGNAESDMHKQNEQPSKHCV